VPLKFQTHRRPAELEEEFRNLYRQIALLRPNIGVGAGAAGPAGPPGEPGAGATGQALVWTKKVDIYEPNPVPGVLSNTISLDPIAGSYTVLEVDQAVIQSPAEDAANAYDVDWILRGNGPFYIWWSDGETPPGYDSHSPYPQFYGWSTRGLGHFRPIPVPATPLYTGDLAYYPINPTDQADQLVFEWSITVPNPAPDYICYKAWLLGRYVLHDPALFGAACPSE